MRGLTGLMAVPPDPRWVARRDGEAHAVLVGKPQRTFVCGLLRWEPRWDWSAAGRAHHRECIDGLNRLMAEALAGPAQSALGL